MMEGPATVDFNQSLSVAGTSQELDRSIACHLCPGNPLISVQTRNCYEIETIMEIFREGGSIHCEHFIDDGGPEDQEPHPLTTNLVHNHSTTLTDRVRETA
jgi:hypothetical protein